MSAPDVPTMPPLAPLRHHCPRCRCQHGGILLCVSCRAATSELRLRLDMPDGLPIEAQADLARRAVKAYLEGHR